MGRTHTNRRGTTTESSLPIPTASGKSIFEEMEKAMELDFLDDLLL
jgi:hypothetical protein